ncbi:hypothetical protein FXO38_21241 [Capsicum annuum]|nr:hypothetical protein FXO38_21241 [Capsicum annuum]
MELRRINGAAYDQEDEYLMTVYYLPQNFEGVIVDGREIDALCKLKKIPRCLIPNDVQCVAFLRNYKPGARMSLALTLTRIDLYGLHSNIWQHFQNTPGYPSNDSVRYIIIKGRVAQNKINWRAGDYYWRMSNSAAIFENGMEVGVKRNMWVRKIDGI